MSDDIRKEFGLEMRRLYDEAGRDLHYWASYYLRGLRGAPDGVTYAKNLLARKPTEGSSRVVEKGRPDLAVEYLVLRPRYSVLFTEQERETAWMRLAEEIHMRAEDGGAGPAA